MRPLIDLSIAAAAGAALSAPLVAARSSGAGTIEPKQRTLFTPPR